MGRRARAELNRQRMTVPAPASIRLSSPKPTKAIEPAAMPAAIAIANSITCQALPPQASARARSHECLAFGRRRRDL